MLMKYLGYSENDGDTIPPWDQDGDRDIVITTMCAASWLMLVASVQFQAAIVLRVAKRAGRA